MSATQPRNRFMCAKFVAVAHTCTRATGVNCLFHTRCCVLRVHLMTPQITENGMQGLENMLMDQPTLADRKALVRMFTLDFTFDSLQCIKLMALMDAPFDKTVAALQSTRPQTDASRRSSKSTRRRGSIIDTKRSDVGQLARQALQGIEIVNMLLPRMVDSVNMQLLVHRHLTRYDFSISPYNPRGGLVKSHGPCDTAGSIAGSSLKLCLSRAVPVYKMCCAVITDDSSAV